MNQTLNADGKVLGNLVRITTDRDSEGILRRRVVVYFGTYGGEIWLNEDQRVSECLRALGILVDTQFADFYDWSVESKVTASQFEQSKAEYCSHPKTQQSAEKFFNEVVVALSDEIKKHNDSASSERRLQMNVLKSYVCIFGCGIRVHGRLEKPKEGAARTLMFECDPYSTKIKVEKIISPRPVLVENGRMVWAADSLAIQPSDLATAILSCATGTN